MKLSLEVRSVASFAAPGALRLVGRALDVDPQFRPQWLSDRDPPRVWVDSAEQALAGYESRVFEQVELYFSREQVPECSGTAGVGAVDAARAAVDALPGVTFPGGVSMYLDEEEVYRSQPQRLEPVAELFVRLCEATDAYRGGVVFESAHRRHLSDISTEARLAGYRARTLPWDGHLILDDHLLPLPDWLTYLGVAYVGFFGRDRVEQLGQRVRWTANGGAVLWATSSPFVHDPQVGTIAAFPFYRRWLEVLGWETVDHEHNLMAQGPGELVPLMAEHVRSARGPEDDPLARVGAWAGRPAGVVEGTQAPAVPPASAWTLETVTRLRALGFFAQWEGEDGQVAAELDERRRIVTGSPWDPDDPWSELELAAEDTARVWWRDTEADVAPGSQAYVTAIGQWAAISRGALVPEHVEEQWDQQAGQVAIRVLLDGVTHELVAQILDDYLDTTVVDQLNELLANRGVAFEQVVTSDQTAYLIVVSPEEKQALSDHGWPFAR